MRAGHHRVGASLDRVLGQAGMEAEVGRPGLVDQQRYARLMRCGGMTGQIPGGADVGRVAEEDAAGVRVLLERCPDRGDRDGGRQAGLLVDLGPDPHRAEPG